MSLAVYSIRDRTVAGVGPGFVRPPQRTSLGLLYLMAVPLAAGVAHLGIPDMGGFSYTGFLWLFFLVTGIMLIVAAKSLPGKHRICFPSKVWLIWTGCLWLSLSWCEGVGSRNIQDAVQISMPLLVGAAGSLFVQSANELERFLRVFGPLVLLLGLTVLSSHSGLLEMMGLTANPRVLGLTAALAGCVLMSRFPERRLVPLSGWILCIALAGLDGSRMATFALLLIPLLHPLFRSRLARGAMIATVAGLGIGLFYTPIFQERFFHEGSGTLTDVAEGNFLSFGRYESWPDIWDEAWRRPWLGHGVGTTHGFVPTVWKEMHHVHNDYLRVGFELGLIGVTIFVSVLLWQLNDLRSRIKQSHGAVRTAFVASWLGFAVFMITSATDNTLIYNVWYMNPLFALMGAAYGVARHDGIGAVKGFAD